MLRGLALALAGVALAAVLALGVFFASEAALGEDDPVLDPRGPTLVATTTGDATTGRTTTAGTTTARTTTGDDEGGGVTVGTGTVEDADEGSGRGRGRGRNRGRGGSDDD